jgi:hypothetical protein
VLDKSQGKLASCRTDGDYLDMLYMDIVSREFYKDFASTGPDWRPSDWIFSEFGLPGRTTNSRINKFVKGDRRRTLLGTL